MALWAPEATQCHGPAHGTSASSRSSGARLETEASSNSPMSEPSSGAGGCSSKNSEGGAQTLAAFWQKAYSAGFQSCAMKGLISPFAGEKRQPMHFKSSLNQWTLNLRGLPDFLGLTTKKNCDSLQRLTSLDKGGLSKGA